MKNKCGFTLIELLAVIIVLAIITLITTPIVNKTLETAKKGTAERSADGYIRAAETTVSRERLNGHVLEGEYEITTNGNICENKQATCGDSREIEIAATGRKPKGGKLMIIKGEVSISSSIDMGDYDVVYDKEKNKYVAYEKGTAPAETLCTKKDGVDLANLTYGNEFTCELGDNDLKTFYVLEINGDNVSLIMNANVDSTGKAITSSTMDREVVAWCDDSTECKIDGDWNAANGAFTANKALETWTLGWTKLKQSQIKLPTKVQIEGAYTDSMPIWLYNYLSDTTNPTDMGGYWTSTPHPAPSYSSYAFAVISSGRVSSMHIIFSTGYGIRPVITISKSNLG